jgi:Domain of unknown function (DUF4148)
LQQEPDLLEVIMKALIRAVALAAALIVPAAAFAYSNGEVTHAQLQAELTQLEKSGYNPHTGSDPHYPADIQQAEARVAAKNVQLTSYSGSDNSATSTPAVSSTQPKHHRFSFLHRNDLANSQNGNACTGPASFCNIYFGG